MKLNDAQQKAMIHGTGPLLVLAGPGSGKTAVITRRVLWLTTKCQVAPGNILVITFTKAAAMEMQERYERLCMEQRDKGNKPSKGLVNFGTFHAVFFKILKLAYNYSAANIIKEEDSYQLLSEIIRQAELEIEDEKDFIEGIKSEISKIKSERIKIEDYYSLNCPEEAFQKIYRDYEAELRRRNLIDFDDMLLLCYELLVKHKDILASWQEKYQYILIDEFQDINRIQYEIVRMLAKPQDNLFVVGDDDQSIYQFRGAKPEIMLNFCKDYPSAGQILLNYNYRSKATIIQAALRLVSHNKNRFSKEILAVKEDGAPIVTEVFPTQEEENEKIIDLIRQYHRKGIPYPEMAVLFRTNTQARSLMGKLMAFGVPFRMRDTVPNLFDHWIAKNVIAYLKVAMGSRDRGLILQIMNRPKRFLARESIDSTVVNFEAWKSQYRDKKWAIENIEKLEYDLNLISKTNPYAAINYIRRAVGYDQYLEEYAKYRRMRPEELYETMNELQESARGFTTFDEWFLYMEQYKEELLRQREKKQQASYSVPFDGVTLETMHSAKGLEYEVVMIPDANEGITPYKKAISPEDVEEERRMFYVAATRAKQFLHVYSVRRLHGKELDVSRFVGEMKLAKIELVPGCRLQHKTYGEGTLTKKEGSRITIYFDRLHEEKTFEEEVCLRNQVLTLLAE